MSKHLIRVEVAYALPDEQTLIPLDVEPGTTALEAVRRSGILERHTGIDPQRNAMGVFASLLDGQGSPAPADYVLRDNDRVEIYRPLEIDPKQARLARAARKTKG